MVRRGSLYYKRHLIYFIPTKEGKELVGWIEGKVGQVSADWHSEEVGRRRTRFWTRPGGPLEGFSVGLGLHPRGLDLLISNNYMVTSGH